MKKIITSVLAFAMMLSVLAFPGAGVQTAKAAGVTFTVTASPTSVASGGDNVTYAFHIANDTGEVISNVSITSSILTSAVSVGNIADGGEENPTRTISTKPSTVTFKLNYSNASGVAQASITKTVTITQKTSTADLAFEREVDKTVVAKNGTVTVTYTLQNNSDEPLTITSLKDNFSTVAIASAVTLSAGSAEKVYTKTYTVTKDVSSAPIVTYKYLGVTHTKTLDPISIKLGTATLEVSTVSDKTTASSGDTVKFTTTIKNTGTEDLSDIALVDQDSNTVATGLSIASGETKTVETNVTVTSDKSVYFTAKGKDSQGNTISIKSNTVSIVLGSALKEGLSLTVKADKESINEGEAVKFTFTIKNTSSGIIKNIGVGEAGAEEALTEEVIASLAPGATGTLTATIGNLNSTANLTFMAVGTNAAGRQIEVEADSITISVNSLNTVTPVATDIGINPGGLGTLLTIFIIIIVLIIVSVIVLMVLVSKEKKKKKLIAAQRSKQQLQQKKTGNNGNNGNKPRM